jgi:hypothetical protein
MFITVEESLVIVKKYCQLEESDTTHDVLLTIFLEESKAFGNALVSTTVTTTDENSQTVVVSTEVYPDAYRPFIVAAKFLKFNPLRDGVTEATGTDTVKWQSQDKNIDGLINMQRSLDRSLKKIPVGWTTGEALKVLHTLGAFLAD